MGSYRGRRPAPGDITLLWLPSSRVTAGLFSGVLGSGCGSHGGTLQAEFSLQLPGTCPFTQLRSTPPWDTAGLEPGEAGLGRHLVPTETFVSTNSTGRTCLPRGPERGLQANRGGKRARTPRGFACCRWRHLPWRTRVCKLCSVRWLPHDTRRLASPHSAPLTPGCCAQSSMPSTSVLT